MNNKHAQHALYIDECTTLSSIFSSIISILLYQGTHTQKKKKQFSAALLHLLLELWINPSYDSMTPSTASLWIGKASTSLNLSLSYQHFPASKELAAQDHKILKVLYEIWHEMYSLKAVEGMRVWQKGFPTTFGVVTQGMPRWSLGPRFPRLDVHTDSYLYLKFTCTSGVHLGHVHKVLPKLGHLRGVWAKLREEARHLTWQRPDIMFESWQVGVTLGLHMV